MPRRNWSATPGEHGVEVLPVDVNRSDWDCTMEKAEGGGREADSARLRRCEGLATFPRYVPPAAAGGH